MGTRPLPTACISSFFLSVRRCRCHCCFPLPAAIAHKRWLSDLATTHRKYWCQASSTHFRPSPPLSLCFPLRACVGMNVLRMQPTGPHNTAHTRYGAWASMTKLEAKDLVRRTTRGGRNHTFSLLPEGRAIAGRLLRVKNRLHSRAARHVVFSPLETQLAVYEISASSVLRMPSSSALTDVGCPLDRCVRVCDYFVRPSAQAACTLVERLVRMSAVSVPDANGRRLDRCSSPKPLLIEIARCSATFL